MKIEPMQRRISGWWSAGLFLTVLAVVAYPPAIALWEQDTLGAFSYFAPDSFYYLSIADHSKDLAYFSFDGVHPTNGFHPLWLLYLERSFSVLSLVGADQIRWVAISSLLFTALGSALFAVSALRVTRSPALALLAAVPGFFYLAMPNLGTHFGSQWSFANGMESPLSVLLFGVLTFWLFSDARLHRHWSRRDLLTLSILLTLITLTRLDDVFIFVPFALHQLLSNGSRREGLKRVAVLCTLPALSISGYLIYNYLYAGSFLPSSGMAKTQPLWALARNAYAAFTTVFPFLDFIRGSNPVWKSEAWRILQMVVPACVAAYWLHRHGSPLRRTRTAHPSAIGASGVISLLAGYVVLKALYNFSMVGLWHQGSWYYVVSIMITNLIVAAVLAEVLRDESGWAARHLSWRGGLGTLLPSALAMSTVLLSTHSLVDRSEAGRSRQANHQFWAERETTRQLLAEVCNHCGVVEFDDGIVSYALHDSPTLNGLGLATDLEAIRAMKEGRLLDLAWKRGHRLIATVNYAMDRSNYTDPEVLDRAIRRNPHLAGQSLSNWEFELALESPSSQVFFLKFRPRADGRPPRLALEPLPPPTPATRAPATRQPPRDRSAG